MTVIAYCPEKDVIYADRKYSWDDGLSILASKVHSTDDHCYTYAAAGTIIEPIVQVAIELLRAGTTFRLMDEHFSRMTRGAELLIRDNDNRRVYYAYVNSHHVVVERNETILAIGSGAALFRALRLTRPNDAVLDTITTVASLVPSCGGEIDEF